MSSSVSYPGLSATFHAERLAWRGSVLKKLLLLGLVFLIITSGLYLASAQVYTKESILAYENMWTVCFGPFSAGLLGTWMAYLSRRYRGGGTWMRATIRRRDMTARLMWLAGALLAQNLLAIVVPATLAIVSGAEPMGMVGIMVRLAVVLALTQLLVSLCAFLVAERYGRFVALAMTVIWIGIGVMFGEDSLSLFLPFTWVIRAPLPIIGTHVNGVALAHDSALAASPTWLPTVLSAILAVVIALVVPRPKNMPQAIEGE